MSEHSTPEERTEAPTGKRMDHLRKEGSIHMSMEVVQVFSIGTAMLILYFIAAQLLEDLKYFVHTSFNNIDRHEYLTQHNAYDLIKEAFYIFAPDVAMLTFAVAATATLAVMLQTNWNIKKKKIDFKWKMIQPLEGFKRILSPRNYVKTLASILKLCVIIPIGYFALIHFAPEMIMLVHLSVEQIFEVIADAIFYVFWKVLYVLIAFAIFDYFYTKFQWLKQNRMTKAEVKDERKAMEGDELTKRKIQMKGLQRIMNRIQQSVPQADVVITNPTHYAVALKYDRKTMSAPQVVAKGKGFLALRIRKIAKAAGVPILERKPLARALYASTEVGTEIPRELFRAVAQVLAFVYKLKNPHTRAAEGRS